MIPKMPWYDPIEWTRERADARSAYVAESIRCGLCKHSINFVSSTEAVHFIESSYDERDGLKWTRENYGEWVCPVCQTDLKRGTEIREVTRAAS